MKCVHDNRNDAFEYGLENWEFNYQTLPLICAHYENIKCIGWYRKTDSMQCIFNMHIETIRH